MDRDKYLEIWNELIGGPETVRDITNTRPILAHYTSMHNVKSILTKGEIWLSNPLNMNDHQEVTFGINAAINVVSASGALREAFPSHDLYQAFLKEFLKLYEDYGSREVKDLYVACFSEHETTDFPDGKLSMWRGYGDSGDGAAIVFGTSALRIPKVTPFRLAAVEYLADNDRYAATIGKVQTLIRIVRSKGVSAEDVPALAHAFFRRAVLAAVFTKHSGFAEEREWRLAYFPDDDTDGTFHDMIGYHYGPSGLEPKLKLLLEGSENEVSFGLDLNEMISSIVIGPRVASPLNIHAATIMLKKIGREQMTQKLFYSRIPFRR